MGDTHYRRYVEHRHRSHPGQQLLSEAEYWRLRHRAAERTPDTRCC